MATAVTVQQRQRELAATASKRWSGGAVMPHHKLKKVKMIRKLLVVSTLLATASLAITGCVTVNDSVTVHGGMMHGTSEFSSAEVMFAQMMIPHHEQAVLMSTWAETRATNQEVKDLAKRIKDEQAPEIEQMKSWLPNGYEQAMGDHGMYMAGMLDADQLEKLKASSGSNFDRLFLEGMIGHHQGAIEMTSMLASSTNAEAIALRKAIIDSQSAEINHMNVLLTSLD